MIVCLEEQEILEMIDLINCELVSHGPNKNLEDVNEKLQRALYDEEG